jgi:hypothetical protein
MRGISNQFINDLKNGELAFFLNEAKTNPSISLEIRKNYINIYYRGGNAVKITEKRRGYSFKFDSKYCLNKDNDQNYQYLYNLNKRDTKQFIAAFPTIMSEMDSWFAAHPKPERDFQHNLIKQNQKDPIVLDIEYAGWTADRRLFRLDMLALRKTPDGYHLIIIENKFGTGAIGGKAGLKKHYDDIAEILSFQKSCDELIDSVISIAANKTELGLINAPLSRNDIKDHEVLFIFANFNAKSRTIANEVNRITQTIPARLMFIPATQTTINYAETKNLFSYED